MGRRYEPVCTLCGGERTSYSSRCRITIQQYEDMLAAQDGKCGSCGDGPESSPKGVLYVDHDHSTGQVRGLLCGRCNFAVGLLDDDPTRIRRLAAYLEAHQHTLKVVSD